MMHPSLQSNSPTSNNTLLSKPTAGKRGYKPGSQWSCHSQLTTQFTTTRTNCYSLLLHDFNKDLMLISKKPESCWLAMAAASCWISPPNCVSLQKQQQQQQQQKLSWDQQVVPVVTSLWRTQCCADEILWKHTHCFTPPPVSCPWLSLFLSKAMAGSGRQSKLPLNNCTEAESAGSNPLSRVQLIITTVCLCGGFDNNDSTGHVDLSAWLGAPDGSHPLTEEMKNAWNMTKKIMQQSKACSGAVQRWWQCSSVEQTDKINSTHGVWIGADIWLLTLLFPSTCTQMKRDENVLLFWGWSKLTQIQNTKTAPDHD